MKSLKLSELNDDMMIFRNGDSRVYEVGELKHEILEYGEDHYKHGGWHLGKEKFWEPSAKDMIEDYIIGHYEDGNMYEDWDEYALDSLRKTGIERVQEALDNLVRDSGITRYYEACNAVEIDVVPK